MTIEVNGNLINMKLREFREHLAYRKTTKAHMILGFTQID